MLSFLWHTLVLEEERSEAGVLIVALADAVALFESVCHNARRWSGSRLQELSHALIVVLPCHLCKPFLELVDLA